ncbi:MAG TPA: CHAT domain-containing protein [Longimicrobiaceae bacterium]|nr:CHAT domain-containing protein [Longimicrobiaceae bacterium]
MARLKVLFVSADPSLGAASRLRIDEEMRAVQERVRASEYRDGVEFVFAPAARPLDLIQALNTHRPQAVHFSGHGTDEGTLQFVGNDGGARPVSPRLLADVFRKVRGAVRLVVLNACSSRSVAQAVAEVVDCAVGMSEQIPDDTAITFSAAFYGALGFALSVREAFDQGTLAIGLQDQLGAEIPELFARPTLDLARMVLVSGGPHTPCDAALAVVRDELQRNLGSLAWQISHTLVNVPSGDPVPQRPGEPRAGFYDRDRRWFSHAVSDAFVGYAQFALETGGYEAHRLNLAECDELRRQSAERAYAALDEVEKRLAIYRLHLNGLVDGSHTLERRAEWVSLYSRQAANSLAILWCEVLEVWVILEPDELMVTLVGTHLSNVLRGVTVAQPLVPGTEGRAFALAASTALHEEKSRLIAEEMLLSGAPAVAAEPSTAIETLAAAGLAWAEGRPADSVAAFEKALSFPDVPEDQRRFAETSLRYLRDPDRFGGVLGSYLLDVSGEGTAAKAGLEAGDVIIRYNGAPVAEPYELSRLISRARGAPLVQVEVVREGEPVVRFVPGGASLSARATRLVCADSFAV